MRLRGAEEWALKLPTKALRNKRGGGGEILITEDEHSLFPSPFFFFPCTSLTVHHLPLSGSLRHLPPSALCPRPLSIHPSNHLFIADLFIMYPSSLGTVHAVSAGCKFTLAASYHHSFTPLAETSSSSSSPRYTWGRARSLRPNLTPY